MAKTIAEDQIHEMTLTMPFDLSGQTLQAVYVAPDGTTTQGGTVNGDVEGNDVTIRTDLAASGIEPGSYGVEVNYDDNGTLRELGIDGEDEIRVHDAKSVS